MWFKNNLFESFLTMYTTLLCPEWNHKQIKTLYIFMNHILLRQLLWILIPVFHKSIIIYLVLLVVCKKDKFRVDLNIHSTDIRGLFITLLEYLVLFVLSSCSDICNHFYNFHKGHKELSLFANIQLWGSAIWKCPWLHIKKIFRWLSKLYKELWKY